MGGDGRQGHEKGRKKRKCRGALKSKLQIQLPLCFAVSEWERTRSVDCVDGK